MKLEAKTAKGKQLIKKFGDEWDVLATSPVSFAPNIWWLMSPANLDGREAEAAARWVNPSVDKNFSIIP